ncbi:tetratricopeptide repeat protein [Pelomonas saccharophila]|nr:tetratricopeptide repeat protein [Roseateles saccharophilus]
MAGLAGRRQVQRPGPCSPGPRQGAARRRSGRRSPGPGRRRRQRWCAPGGQPTGPAGLRRQAPAGRLQLRVGARLWPAGHDRQRLQDARPGRQDQGAVRQGRRADPLLFEARSGLTQFYLMAPGFAGGSTAKARELAAEVQARQPEQAKLLRALLAMNDKDWAGAERELAGVKAGDDRTVARELRGSWVRLGFELMEQKNLPKARGIFESLQRDYPAHAAGPYGLGRVLTEMGQAEEAVRSLERARGLEGAERLPIDHRLGQALLAKGEKAGAKAALERFVQNKRANPRNVEDAKKLLAGMA